MSKQYVASHKSCVLDIVPVEMKPFLPQEELETTDSLGHCQCFQSYQSFKYFNPNTSIYTA